MWVRRLSSLFMCDVCVCVICGCGGQEESKQSLEKTSRSRKKEEEKQNRQEKKGKGLYYICICAMCVWETMTKLVIGAAAAVSCKKKDSEIGRYICKTRAIREGRKEAGQGTKPYTKNKDPTKRLRRKRPTYIHECLLQVTALVACAFSSLLLSGLLSPRPSSILLSSRYCTRRCVLSGWKPKSCVHWTLPVVA